MALSGTYGFNPGLGALVLYAFNRCGIRNTALTQSHYESARTAANMVCMDWSNKGVNLWQVSLVTTPLVQGTATYSVDPSVVLILDAYVVQNTGGAAINRLLLPISRSEYASYPNLNQQGFPTVFWHDRLLSPTVTIWPVPDGNETSFNYYALKQLQDANYIDGQQVDIPPIWQKAFSDALSLELAVMWAPDRVEMLAPLADKSFETAAETGVEKAQQYFSPVLSGYWT